MADETLNTEVIYLARMRGSVLYFAKFVDGSPQPVETYQIIGSRCDCPGAIRSIWCKHRKMQQRWEESGNPFHTIAYDERGDFFYDLPGFTDGEPILNGQQVALPASDRAYTEL